MTLLGVFSIGSSTPSEPAQMSMSLGESKQQPTAARRRRRRARHVAPAEKKDGLFHKFSNCIPRFALLNKDAMIKNRKQQDKKPKKAAPKAVTNADKSVGTSKAKRKAALDARRGLTKSSKPTKAQVDEEIKKQVQKKAAVQSKKRVPVNDSPGAKAEKRRQKREAARSGAATFGGATIVSGKSQGVSIGRPLSQKALRAAKTAIEATGFKIPPGLQMVIAFAPKEEEDKKKPAAWKPSAKKAPPKKNAGKGRGQK